MAGHSKWANIKHKKAATDAKQPGKEADPAPQAQQNEHIHRQFCDGEVDLHSRQERPLGGGTSGGAAPDAHQSMRFPPCAGKGPNTRQNRYSPKATFSRITNVYAAVCPLLVRRIDEPSAPLRRDRAAHSNIGPAGQITGPRRESQPNKLTAILGIT